MYHEAVNFMCVTIFCDVVKSAFWESFMGILLHAFPTKVTVVAIQSVSYARGEFPSVV